MMKRLISMLTAVMLTAGGVHAALTANIYGHAAAPDGDWNDANNWWTVSVPTANTKVYFRGDNLADGNHDVDIGASASAGFITFTAEKNANTAYNIMSSSSGSLTIDASVAGVTGNMIEMRDAVVADQTISADLILRSNSNSADEHIRTRNCTAALVLAGSLSQASSSLGIGVVLGNGDVEVAGGWDGSGKVWNIWRPDGGTGVLEITGTSAGSGLMIINSGAEVLLNNASVSSTAMGIGNVYLRGGRVALARNDQISNSLTLQFDVGAESILALDGHTETIAGFKFGSSSHTGSVDMGDGGVLRLASQSSSATWGALTVLNWDEDSDHIYVDGGSFSPAQLAAVTFDSWEPTGAKVENGELLPTGSLIIPSGYETWASEFGVGAETNDYDGDGLLNVYEYGMGGNPTNAADQGISSVFGVVDGSLVYIHPQLSDINSGLNYYLELSEDLGSPVWSNAGYVVTGTNVVGDFDYVTNQISTDVKAAQFIKLVIDTQ